LLPLLIVITIKVMTNKISYYFKKFIKFLFSVWTNTALFIGSAILGLTILTVILIQTLAKTDSFETHSRILYQGDAQEIAYVRLAGEIAYSTDDSLLGFKPFVINPIRVRQLFSYLAQSNRVEAIVLDVNSPGGSVAASEEVYQQVKSLSLAKPVFVYFGDIATSGAYYISLPAEKITASIPTITGSIGVVAFDPDLSGLYDKLGIDIQTYQSGPYKDIGSINRAATLTEREIFESIIEDSYQLFIDRVEENRPLDRDIILTIADGRIYSGKQALENGLIDSLGTIDSVFDDARLSVLVDDPSIKEYFLTGSRFGSFLGVQNLNLLPSSIFETPLQTRLGLYYLWTR